MSRNIFAGGGVQTFQGSNNPLYVQNMNSLKAAFTDLQDSIDIAAPIGAVVMWTGTTTNIPAGFAVCNGAYLSTATYSALYAIIGTRYGALVGSTFRLPDLTSRIPRGTVGVPTVPTTVTTSSPSNVDAHTHTVNSSLSLGNLNSHTHSGGVLTPGSVNTSITAPGGANAAIGVNSSFTAGNSADHLHGLFFNSGATDINHAHTTNVGSQSNNHVHAYSKPNGSSSSTTTGIQQTNANHDHAVVVNVSNLGAHTHTIIGNSGAADRTLSVNSSFTAGNAASHTHSGGVLTAGNTNTSITAPGAPNANSTIALTAGNASTINGSVSTHTHTTPITELVFIIKVI